MSNHKRWKHSGVTFSKRVEERRQKEKDARRQVEVRICPKCSTSFEVRGTVASLSRGRVPKFCCRACANGREQTEEIRQKKSRKLKKADLPAIICPTCTSSFVPKRSKQKYCSRLCGTTAKRLVGKDKVSYYRQAQFRFNLKDFPDEFDFTIVRTHGWYRATNRGGDGSLSGVSRDHMLSINYGFRNEIDPGIIAHPANCQLMVHSANVQKRAGCSITHEELLQRITEWNDRYKFE